MKFYKAKDLLAERYGKEGSAERDEFNAKAFANYYGEIIKHRRKELRMTQKSLAEKVGKKRPYISRVENGEDIQLSNYVLIANALGLVIELKAV